MKRTILLKAFPLALLIGGLVMTVSFAQTGAGRNKNTGADTVPKKQKQVRDLDEALLELDKGEVEMQKALREIDAEKIEREVREAMKGVQMDMTKMKEDVAKAMKDIDMQKINLEVQKGMAEMQKALKEVDAEKIKNEVQMSLAKIDMEKMKAKLEKVKEIDLSKMKKELEEIRPEMEKAMREAREDIQKAREQITAYKGLVNALDKDGYLKKDGSYKVEYKSGELTVNGKKLSSDAAKKYSEYLSGQKDFTLEKSDEEFNIHHK